MGLVKEQLWKVYENFDGKHYKGKYLSAWSKGIKAFKDEQN